MEEKKYKDPDVRLKLVRLDRQRLINRYHKCYQCPIKFSCLGLASTLSKLLPNTRFILDLSCANSTVASFMRNLFPIAIIDSMNIALGKEVEDVNNWVITPYNLHVAHSSNWRGLSPKMPVKTIWLRKEWTDLVIFGDLLSYLSYPLIYLDQAIRLLRKDGIIMSFGNIYSDKLSLVAIIKEVELCHPSTDEFDIYLYRRRK